MTISSRRSGGARHLELVQPVCYLCIDPVPALPFASAVVRLPWGGARLVPLCEVCYGNRPGRFGEEILAADYAWWALRHEAAMLRDTFREEM